MGADGGTSGGALGHDEEVALAKALFNATWELLDRPSRTADEDDRAVHLAHASVHHWAQVGGPLERVRGEWLCSRAYAVVGRAEPALHHARAALAACEAAGIGGFDLAFCVEAVARALALAGHAAEAGRWLTRARDLAAEVEDDDDRALLLADLATIEA